jgi:hypothetical protein
MELPDAILENSKEIKPEPPSPPRFSFEEGLEFLKKYHADFSDYHLEIYGRAYHGPIQGKMIAFDLDETIAGAEWKPEHHDSRPGGIHFQRELERTPYRGIQALLLGLSAGNQLKLYTSGENLRNYLVNFLNDFPLLKAAFQLTTFENAKKLVNNHDVDVSPFVMHRLKRDVIGKLYFPIPRKNELVRHLENTLDKFEGCEDCRAIAMDLKLPMPTFRFDVLVDDGARFEQPLEAFGVGFINTRRYTHIYKEFYARELLKSLEEFFSKQHPKMDTQLQKWLEQRPH